jgi:hypothetical protein
MRVNTEIVTIPEERTNTDELEWNCNGDAGRAC